MLDIKAWRQRMGLSQETVARLVDRTVTTVSHYESGKQRAPRLFLLALVALEHVELEELAAVGVDIEKLMRRKRISS